MVTFHPELPPNKHKPDCVIEEDRVYVSTSSGARFCDTNYGVIKHRQLASEGCVDNEKGSSTAPLEASVMAVAGLCLTKTYSPYYLQSSRWNADICEDVDPHGHRARRGSPSLGP